MAIRMTGLVSGLDTEAIIKELMSVQSLKKTKVEKAKTKLEWKQTTWADLNTKLMNLYNNYVTKMQLTSTYCVKKTSISDSSIASVTADSSAANGSYTMEVNNIATSQYLTGSKLTADSVKTKLTDLDSSLLNKEIEISYGENTVNFEVTADSTISDFVTALKSAGLNASYDTTQKRFMISSKESGADNAFTITTSGLSQLELQNRDEVKRAAGYDDMTDANKAIVNTALETLRTSGVDTDEYNDALDAIAKASYETQKDAANSAATTYVKAQLYSENYAEQLQKAEDSLKSEYYDEDGNIREGKTEEEYREAVETKADNETTALVDQEISSEDSKLRINEALYTGKTETDISQLDSNALAKYYKDGVTGFDSTQDLSQENVKADLENSVNAYAGMTDADRHEAVAGSALSGLGLADVVKTADGKVAVSGTVPQGMAFIEGTDSEILLNGAVMTSSSSTVKVNGLSIELTGKTKGEAITFSVSNDVEGVYNSIKEFLKEYNSVMKEMYTLYNAESASDYEPLTSEEKEAMTDSDIELWENKIKDSLLRNDSTLGSIIQSMRNAMMTSIEYDGKKYALSSFGIMTSTDYTEGGQLHIYGDADDATYSSKDDKLKKALEEDPDAVVAALSGIFTNLRTTMSQKMASTKYSSALTFYQDIKIKDDIKSYEDDIEEWEDKLADMEDSYYSKFAAMETALAKLQSQQSSLGSILGS